MDNIKKNIIINVGRQIGSGGRIIAKMLADEFGCSIDCLIGREPIENDYGFTSKTTPKPFCDNFNEILSEKGLTEYRLVKMMGVSRTKISSWRKGNSLPDAKGLCDLADALDVSADSLAGRI